MSTMAQVPADSPLWQAWKVYEQTDDFKNSLIWATAENYAKAGAHNAAEPDRPFTGIQREQFAKGSLWTAFVAGFSAAKTLSVSAVVAEVEAATP